MRHLVPALLLPLLAACASPAPTTPEGQCEAQSWDDPAVKALMLRELSSPYLRYTETDQIAYQRRLSIQACLTAKGLAPPGGVQPVLK